MKLKQLINGGALAATVLTLGSAQAGMNPNEGVVFCKATIMRSDNFDERNDVSVTLPFTEGRDYTYWNLGNVPAGGVADSWHSEGGPGRFVAENTGRVGAYIYMTSGKANTGWWSLGSGEQRISNPGAISDISRITEEIFNGNAWQSIGPSSSLLRWKKQVTHYAQRWYCLAFTRDEKVKTPTWHMLNRSYDRQNSRWVEGECGSDTRYSEYIASKEANDQGYIGAYMGYLPAHDFMSFDVKFWAPWTTMTNDNGETMDQSGAFFTFQVEAASFPLWEHDADIQ